MLKHGANPTVANQVNSWTALHCFAWQGDDGVTVCDYDGYRRTEKSTKTEAHIECLQKVPDGMAHGWWRSTYTYMRAKHCVRMHCLPRVQVRVESRVCKRLLEQTAHV